MKRPDASFQLLACTYIRKQARILSTHLDGIRIGDNIESIHQARVSSRRICTALNIFEKAFPKKKVCQWNKHVRRIIKGFGIARDMDVEQLLASGFGAFVEGRHLAGIGALLDHPGDGAGEIASLYTLTRFLGEGMGGHLVRFALERARELGRRYVFACTTSESVVGFFEREGFRIVDERDIPQQKWRGYDSERRARVTCLRREL